MIKNVYKLDGFLGKSNVFADVLNTLSLFLVIFIMY